MDNAQRLLFALLRSDGEAEGSVMDGFASEDVDWTNFLRLTRHHRVYPSVYRRLKKEASYAVPEPVMRQLQEQYRQNAVRMLGLAGESARIGAGLADRGIRSLFLKGPTLAHELYGDMSLRTSSDLDILLDWKPFGGDRLAVDRMMAELGYVAEAYTPTVLNEWRWRQHHKSYWNPKLGVHIEIHWRLSPGPLKEPGFEELWSESRVSALGGGAVRYMGSKHLFYYLIMHGARHGWFRLRWLTDIDVLARRDEDWPQVRRLLRKYGAAHLGDQAMTLASKLLGTPVPAGIALGTQPNSKGAKLAQNPFFYVEQSIDILGDPPVHLHRAYKRYLFAIRPPLHKLLFLLSLLHPYPTDFETLPLPKRVHFLYFPLRPLLWAWRKTRRTAVT
ncbi:nucleotidyltransferase family protein [Cohnella sp. GbtcB17]|uniref:nucleotidyltransferase domain-containing protein n=1 Tax=Cohnella sp. GbtcB17 TaxID=2824762 RepID=UPI001C2F6034|nr:nucleotidyltransferase family protein [Cohnella sp. GbtcB17]